MAIFLLKNIFSAFLLKGILCFKLSSFFLIVQLQNYKRIKNNKITANLNHDGSGVKETLKKDCRRTIQDKSTGGQNLSEYSRRSENDIAKYRFLIFVNIGEYFAIFVNIDF